MALDFITLFFLLHSRHICEPGTLSLCLASLGSIGENRKGTNGSGARRLSMSVNTVSVYKWNIMKADKVIQVDAC